MKGQEKKPGKYSYILGVEEKILTAMKEKNYRLNIKMKNLIVLRKQP